MLNDAATLPASLRASGELELRLMSLDDDGSWLALTLGSGDFRVATEQRGTPELLAVGAGARLRPRLAGSGSVRRA